MRGRKSVKIGKGEEKKIKDAIDTIIDHYGPILEIWSTLTLDKRAMVIVSNPRIAKLLKYFI